MKALVIIGVDAACVATEYHGATPDTVRFGVVEVDALPEVHDAMVVPPEVRTGIQFLLDSLEAGK